jgi:hypothetical protein
MSNTNQLTAPFAKVLSTSERGWPMVIGDQWVYYASMQEAVEAAAKHNAHRYERKTNL